VCKKLHLPACLPAYLDTVEYKCTLTAFFTIFRTKCCPCVLVMSGKSDVYVEGRHMGEKEKLVFLLQKVEVWNKRDRGMSTAAFRHHYRVNKSHIYYHYY